MDISEHLGLKMPVNDDIVDVTPVHDSFQTIDQWAIAVDKNLEDEASRAKGAEKTLTDNLNAEIERAKGVEGTRESGNYISATRTLASNIKSLDSQLKSEKDRASGAETTLTNNLSTETSRATKAEGDLNTALTTETTRATDAENALSERISANKASIDTLNGTGAGSVSKAVSDAVAKILDDAPENYDTLKEIADQISSHSTSADTTITTINSRLKTLEDKTSNVENKTDVNRTVGKADKLTTARTISLSGDVTGSTTFDGSANATITATVADNSHNHTIANVTGLQDALDAKADATALDDKMDKVTLATVATSGLYNDLTDAPKENSAENPFTTIYMKDSADKVYEVTIVDGVLTAKEYVAPAEPTE